MSEWSADKTLLLCDGWAEGKQKALADLLGVSVPAVRSKAQRIGLPSTRVEGRRPRKRLSFLCQQCGAQAEGPAHYKYCSRKCSGLAHTARFDKLRTPCPVCGGPRKARSDAIHCSRACGVIASLNANRRHEDDFRTTVAQLWAAGLSAKRIGETVVPNVTKNVIVGLVHRMGLPQRPNPVAGARARTPRPPRIRRAPRVTLPKLREPAVMRSEPPRKAPPAAPKPVQRAPEPPRPLARYSPHNACQWPIGEPGAHGFRFCEAVPTEPGMSYCLQHCRDAYIGYRRRGVTPFEELAA